MKLRVWVLWATWMVGQRFVSLLENHPWFEIWALAASPRSAWKTYAEACKWAMSTPMPEAIKGSIVHEVQADINDIKSKVDFVFSALSMDKEEIRQVESSYARLGIPVISNNSAFRESQYVPMVIPEINDDHLDIIPLQQRHFWWDKGFIAVKSNCSIQSYVPALHPLMKFGIRSLIITTLQAISWAWKTFDTWPEMVDNVIPFIWWEESKSEREPLKIWWKIESGVIKPNTDIVIWATCTRVPASDGHMATVSIKFDKKPSESDILELWKNYKGYPQIHNLPSAPKQFLTYFPESNRPQTRLDRDAEKWMWITIWRLRPCRVNDYSFVWLSHNTLRWAAWWAVLLAETLLAKWFIEGAK